MFRYSFIDLTSAQCSSSRDEETTNCINCQEIVAPQFNDQSGFQPRGCRRDRTNELYKKKHREDAHRYVDEVRVLPQLQGVQVRIGFEGKVIDLHKEIPCNVQALIHDSTQCFFDCESRPAEMSGSELRFSRHKVD